MDWVFGLSGLLMIGLYLIACVRCEWSQGYEKIGGAGFLVASVVAAALFSQWSVFESLHFLNTSAKWWIFAVAGVFSSIVLATAWFGWLQDVNRRSREELSKKRIFSILIGEIVLVVISILFAAWLGFGTGIQIIVVLLSVVIVAAIASILKEVGKSGIDESRRERMTIIPKAFS